MDLCRLLEKIVESFRDRKVDLLFDLKIPGSPIMVSADAQKLNQVFENILINTVCFVH